MKIQPVIDRIEHEMDVLRGEATKDVTYVSQNTWASDSQAREAFSQAVKKLLDVNSWSNLSSLTAGFQLYDATGNPKYDAPPLVGDYIRVTLPGPMPENWVCVSHTLTTEKQVAFTVQPSHNPNGKDGKEIDHFFHQQARSTFQVELRGNTIIASEMGRQEGINNQSPEAGNRAVINTAIAEVGWWFYQKFQWKQLTDYLVAD